MSFGYNRINYGIHSICAFRISDGLPYGILKVLGGGTLTLSSEFEEMFGGSNKNAWAVESKTISTEWTASVKTMPDFMFELFLGASVNAEAASATGTVDSLKAIEGTSTVDAVTGVAGVAGKAGSEADLKDGIYVGVAVSATTFDVYALTDIEFKKLGAVNTLSYLDEALKITATPLTLANGAAVEIVGLGVELTGGSAVAMVIGDTFRFNVRSAHSGLSTIDIGSGSTIFPEHRQLCLSQKRANGDTFELELYKVVGGGMPIPMEEQAFSIPELSMKLVYDECEDKVATIRAKRGISGC